MFFEVDELEAVGVMSVRGAWSSVRETFSLLREPAWLAMFFEGGIRLSTALLRSVRLSLDVVYLRPPLRDRRRGERMMA